MLQTNDLFWVRSSLERVSEYWITINKLVFFRAVHGENLDSSAQWTALHSTSRPENAISHKTLIPPSYCRHLIECGLRRTGLTWDRQMNLTIPTCVTLLQRFVDIFKSTTFHVVREIYIYRKTWEKRHDIGYNSIILGQKSKTWRNFRQRNK